MQEQVINSIKQHCNSLCELGVASKEDIAAILDRITAEEPQQSRQLFNKKQVAEIAKVHPRTVDRWVEEGKLARKTIGNNSCRFDSNEVERFLFG